MASIVFNHLSVSGTALPRRELVLGGQKSGKSRRAEQLALQWLSANSRHKAILIATAQANDPEMAQRIARHRTDRAQTAAALQCVEEPLELASALEQHSAAGTLIVVDCLTLWLTNRLFSNSASSEVPEVLEAPDPVHLQRVAHQCTQDLLQAIDHLPATTGPLVMVSNEIGLGVIPLGAPVRAFLDAQGILHQQLAQRCDRVTLMVAGLPLFVKGAA